MPMLIIRILPSKRIKSITVVKPSTATPVIQLNSATLPRISASNKVMQPRRVTICKGSAVNDDTAENA